jgi:trigger factor
MHAKVTKVSDTEIKVHITAAEPDLTQYKQKVLAKLSRDVKLPGFRSGKAPLSLVEKNIDQQLLQTEFFDEAMSGLYSAAVQQEDVRPVTRPEVSITKFVPFTTLEFEVTTHVISAVKLPDYKAIKVKKPAVTVVAKDVDDVLKSLQTQVAERKDVERAAKDGDQVVIDFKGTDSDGEPIPGAEGKEYPLVLGSGNFIPGFEDALIGIKPGESKEFPLTFPKDYAGGGLAGKKVTFAVTATKVQEVVSAKLDDAFAVKAGAGKFKTLKELKDDIKQQLVAERENETERNYQNEVVGAIVDKTKIVVPAPLIEQQAQHNLDELKRNLTYQGKTYQEFLDAEKTTEEKYRKEILEPNAERQIKMSLVLAEIAEAEKLRITPEELDLRIQLLKGQYTDEAMQAELDKPENRQDIASRMLTEKVVEKLVAYAS